MPTSSPSSTASVFGRVGRHHAEWIADGATLGDTAAIFTWSSLTLGCRVASPRRADRANAQCRCRRRTSGSHPQDLGRRRARGPGSPVGQRYVSPPRSVADRNVLERADARREVDLWSFPPPTTVIHADFTSKTCSSPTTVWSRWTSTTLVRAWVSVRHRSTAFGARGIPTVRDDRRPGRGLSRGEILPTRGWHAVL